MLICKQYRTYVDLSNEIDLKLSSTIQESFVLCRFALLKCNFKCLVMSGEAKEFIYIFTFDIEIIGNI